MSINDDKARLGWESDFPHFYQTPVALIQGQLEHFIRAAGDAQKRAWAQSIPVLQNEVGEVLNSDSLAQNYVAVLEYELPLESRRTDVILLANGTVAVLELKGKSAPSQADLDQTAAYARDLRCYHRECSTRPVIPVCLPMAAKGYIGEFNGVHVVGPDWLDRFMDNIHRNPATEPLDTKTFLSRTAYCPLPTLVQAARELFYNDGQLRVIHRARAATDPAVDEITSIIREAARTNSRRLILVTGVPGAGKTLVGLRIVHSHFLDDLAIPRTNGKPSIPAVFLSGNGPLVEVLQYELRGSGGGGKTFVRGVKDYVKTYSSRNDLIPPEHVLVFDEAQRAYDALQVQTKHSITPGFTGGKSEPEHFIEFADRIPGWCVVIGLIGSGQEIHVGEEGGLVQWRSAVEGSSKSSDWVVFGPPSVQNEFNDSKVVFKSSAHLSLDKELRFHLASDLHIFVGMLLQGVPPEKNSKVSGYLEAQGYHLRITRELPLAKEYLRERYAEHLEARYGLLASSKDRDLVRFGIFNDFQSTKRTRYGPWYGDSEESRSGYSCRHLKDVVTEFGAQGLELDAVLLAWGTDLMRINGSWSNARARGYMRGAHVVDPKQLRLNAYRVLLTRGRDATVVFVPQLPELNDTYDYLYASGFVRL